MLFPMAQSTLALPIDQTKLPLFYPMLGMVALHFLGKGIRTMHLPNEVKEMIHDSLQDTTKSRCELILQKWRKHCIHLNECPFSADGNSVLIFRLRKYKNCCVCSSIRGARNALFGVVMITGHDRPSRHPLVSSFAKGMFNRHSLFFHMVIYES